MRTNRNRWKGNRKRGARIETQAEGRVGPRQRQPSRPLNLLWGRVGPTRFGASFASFRDDGCKLSEMMGASCRMLQQWPQRQHCSSAHACTCISQYLPTKNSHRTQEDDLNRHSKVKSCLTLIQRLLRE